LIVAMSTSFALLHPRKLREMLCACPSADARARAAFEFVRGSTGAEKGFLFLHRSGELVLAASSRDQHVPSGMAEAAAHFWSQQLQAPADDKATRDIGELQAAMSATPSASWVSPTGETFERRILATDRPRWAPVGLVVLAVDARRALTPIRHAHIAAICEAIIDSGDAVPPAP
jgi:hypothetical protein